MPGLATVASSRWVSRNARGGIVTRSSGASTWLPRSTTGYAESLRLQGLIATEHARATAAAQTDWGTIAQRYAELEALTGSPVVRLNRAVAVAEAQGPRHGLALLEGLDDAMPHNHRLPSVQAHLARRAGDVMQARDCYARAIELCANDVERAYLRAQLDELAG